MEEASALAKCIGKSIEKRNNTLLCTGDGDKMDAKDTWAVVRQLNGQMR